MPNYSIAHTEDEYRQAAILFNAYAAWLGIDLCFQNFEQELQQLPMMYGPADGGIILCREQEEYVGCVALRRWSPTDAELKRMWVSRGQEGKGIGNGLLQEALKLAVQCGYQKIKLDTLSEMQPAINLYLKNGFKEIAAYYHNPHPNARYFEKRLG